MEDFLSYFIKINIIFSVLFLVYSILFRKEKFLLINRLLLIGIVFFAFLLPLSPNLNLIPGLTAEPELQKVSESLVIIEPTSQLINLSATVEAFNFIDFAIQLYWIICMILGFKFLIHLFRLYTIIRKSQRYKLDGLIYCEPESALPAFSFFHFIVIAKDNLAPESYQQIILHERSHAKQLHSLDAIFSELVCILLWINPLTYLFRRAVKLNLEYLADEATLHSGTDLKSYQLNLVFNALQLPENLPANYFYSSKLKERILMMNKGNPHFKKAYKYLCILPLMVLMNLLMGFQKAEPPFKQQENSVKPLPQFNEGIQSNTTIIPLKKKTPLSVKSEKKLTSIHIDATTDTVKIKLVPSAIKLKEEYAGIYVIEEQVMTNKELRNALKSTGKLEFILSDRPVIGVYSKQDSNAIKTWGESAKNGVVYVKSRKTK